MRTLLLVFFTAILVAMLWVTTVASLDRSVLTAAGEIWADPWGRATLFDAYFGFLVAFVWIASRERSLGSRLLWLVLLLTLGTIAIAVYFLVALARAPGGDWRTIFPPRRELSP